jgi:hypothetical protein
VLQSTQESTMNHAVPRRDQGRNQARLEFRNRGFAFGRLSADRRHPTFSPGLQMLVNPTMQRADVI